MLILTCSLCSFERRPQLWQMTAAAAPDYVSASQRETVLPVYQADDRMRHELLLTVQEVYRIPSSAVAAH